MNLDITDEQVGEVLSEGGIMILDCWAPWCGPCKMYGPIVEEFSSDNPDVKVHKLNVDENPLTASKHGIRSIPTTIIFKDGQLITKVPGVIQKTKLQEFVDNLG
jgi:thioredoxin